MLFLGLTIKEDANNNKFVKTLIWKLLLLKKIWL
jgi:hypothetical protein